MVTLHDVQHRDLPDFFGPGRRSFRRIAYDRAARNAAAVIVTSEFVRGRAVELLELDPDRVHVVPHGVDHSVFSPGDDEREPFILYPARPWPHKNHARLIEAFARLRETRPRLRLLLTGGGLERLDPLPEGVTRLGSVSDRALVVAVPPRRVPRLPEPVRGVRAAAARGDGVRAARSRRRTRGRSRRSAATRPCSSTRLTPTPSPPAILEADERAQELRERGLARAAEFSWERAARQHEDVYVAAASEAPVGMPTTS